MFLHCTSFGLKNLPFNLQEQFLNTLYIVAFSNKKMRASLPEHKDLWYERKETYNRLSVFSSRLKSCEPQKENPLEPRTELISSLTWNPASNRAVDEENERPSGKQSPLASHLLFFLSFYLKTKWNERFVKVLPGKLLYPIASSVCIFRRLWWEYYWK